MALAPPRASDAFGDTAELLGGCELLFCALKGPLLVSLSRQCVSVEPNLRLSRFTTVQVISRAT